MLKLILITDSSEVAKKAEDSGVDIIMVDLEINGKQERQGGLNTIISNHSLDSIPALRKVLTKSKLMVRINPLFDGSKDEIDTVIDMGADLIMLPMFKSYQELKTIYDLIDGRCKLVPLFETTQALARVDDIIELTDVEHIHIGLNDLRIGLGINFLFEVVSGGIVEYLSTKMKKKNIPFGFGGVARMDSGELPGRLVLSEHVRLGSDAVILSRAFHNNSKTLKELNENVDLEKEVRTLREYEKEYRSGEVNLLENQKEFKTIINRIISL
ncbi:MAG: aldolase/citrate lyase family protein [Balneolaceae bacterium]